MFKKFLANRKRKQEAEIMQRANVLRGERGYMLVRTETIDGQTYIVSYRGQRWKLNATDNQRKKEMKPHKHAELIKAWADGAEIERLDQQTNTWIYIPAPSWVERAVYRIAPNIAKQVVGYTLEIDTLSNRIEAVRAIYDDGSEDIHELI